MSARWSDRQQAMLREMGVTLWLPPQTDAMPLPEAAMPEPVPSEVTAPVPAQAPVASPAPAPVRMSRPVAAPEAPVSPPAPRPLAARPSGVAAMDWPALREAVAGCEACGLCRGRQNTVFGVGHEQAQWMIIGEAPGEQEDRQGEPFVGKAGQLLDNMLRALGLHQHPRVALCTLDQAPSGAEGTGVDNALAEVVARLAPAVVLVMGRVAVRHCLGRSEPLGQLRGQPFTLAGVPAVVTFDAPVLLRSPHLKPAAWEDLCRARALAAAAAQ